MARAFKFVCIILQFSAAVLLTALFMTPARRHPIVNSVIILSIVHCIFGMLPSLLYLASSRYQNALDNLDQHSGWRTFCIADGIVLNYTIIVKSAFAISFTMPCVYLAYRFTHNRDSLESHAKAQFYKRTIIALCVGPFLWGLPAILDFLSQLRHPSDLNSQFIAQLCVVHAQHGQILSLILTLIPLAIAIIASILLTFILFKYYRVPDLRRSLALLQPIQIVRFTALVATIFISAILYSIMLATWARTLESPTNAAIDFALEAWLSTSAVWESATLLIFFFIFAAHEDIYSVWWRWIRQCLPRRGFTPPRFDETVTSHGSKKASTTRGPFRIFAWLSNHRDHIDGEEEESYQCASATARLGKTRNTGTRWEEPAAVNRPPRVFTRHIIQMSYAPFTPSHDLRGLPPPPRHQRCRSHSPRESGIFDSVPSLPASGPKRRAVSKSRKHPAPAQLSDLQAPRPYVKAANTEDRDVRGMCLTSSDERESEGEVTSRTDEVVTQLTVVSSGESVASRATSAAGTAKEGLDLTGTFGVLAPGS